jgi:hypothetical protein
LLAHRSSGAAPADTGPRIPTLAHSRLIIIKAARSLFYYRYFGSSLLLTNKKGDPLRRIGNTQHTPHRRLARGTSWIYFNQLSVEEKCADFSEISEKLFLSLSL